jgi:hypothetical protein
VDELIPMPTIIDPAAKVVLACGHTVWSEHSRYSINTLVPVFCADCGRFRHHVGLRVAIEDA